MRSAAGYWRCDVSWDRWPLLTTLEKARRRETYRKLARIVRGERSELLSLDETRKRLRLFEQTYVGIVPIRVDHVVGSADRAGDFDRDFLPKSIESQERSQDIERAFPLGDFPPIVVYQVGEVFFVIDGHHRVAAANQLGTEYIDAEVTRLKSRVPLDADADVAQLIHAEQQQIFLEETGLKRARPEAHVEFSRPDGYIELLELVKAHGYHLMLHEGEVLQPTEIARHWWETVYLPGVDVIHREGLHEAFSKATDADLFLWVHQRRRAFLPEFGGLTFEEAARKATQKQTGRVSSPRRRSKRSE
jgi:ParB-like nuclease domain